MATCRYLAEGRMTPADVAKAVICASAQDARAFMRQLPVVFQAAVVNANIGGSDEVAILSLIRQPEQVATVIAVDTCLNRHLGGDGGLTEMLRDGIIDDEATEVPAWRMVTVKTPRGEDRVVPIAIDPHRVLIYLKSVAENGDDEWKEAVLTEIGTDFLTFIICHYRQGTFEELDEEDWTTFKDSLEDVWEDAELTARQAQFDPEVIEPDIIDSHTATLRSIFTLPEDLVGAIAGSADELVDDLDG